MSLCSVQDVCFSRDSSSLQSTMAPRIHRNQDQEDEILKVSYNCCIAESFLAVSKKRILCFSLYLAGMMTVFSKYLSNIFIYCIMSVGGRPAGGEAGRRGPGHGAEGRDGAVPDDELHQT